MPGFDMPNLSKRLRHAGFMAAFLGISLSGCTDDDPQDPPAVEADCSGHGELHGDHCHCDPGFSLTADGVSCEPEQDTAVPDIGIDVGVDMGPDMQPDMASDAGIVDEGPGDDAPALEFAPAEISALTGVGDDGARIWSLTAMDDAVHLKLEIYESFGGQTSPGVVEMTSNEANYASCGTCVILQTGCVEHGDHFDCARTFMPRAMGQVRLDAIGASAGDQLAGAFVDLHFQEVTIDADLDTQPVADGAAFSLDEWRFDARLEALGGVEEECGGHGELHGNHCHCDAGYHTDPADPSQCIPN